MGEESSGTAERQIRAQSRARFRKQGFQIRKFPAPHSCIQGMCGRARCSLSREEVRAEAHHARWRDEEAYFPSYNIAPSRSTPVLKQAGLSGDREIHTMKWGLVPSYTKPGEKPDFFRMFNARSESVAEKGVFKRLLGKQRCVVFLNGFYEWKKEGKQKQPYFIFQEGHNAMRLAGLFDVWKGSEEQPMYSFTILTTDSSEKLQWLHDRMPVILPDEGAEEAWLSGESEQTIQLLGKLCLPYNGKDLQWFPVDPAMNNMKKDGPECSQPLKRKAITTFFKPKSANKVCNHTFRSQDATKVGRMALCSRVVEEDLASAEKSVMPKAEPAPESRQDAAGSMDAKPAKETAAVAASPEEAAINADEPVKLERDDDGAAESVQAVESERDGAPEQATGEDAKATDAAKERDSGSLSGKSRAPPNRKRPAAVSPGSPASKKTKGTTPEVPAKGRITAFFRKNTKK